MLTFGERRCLGVRQVRIGGELFHNEIPFTHVPQSLKLDKLKGRRVAMVGANYSHACVVTTQGDAFLWGEDFAHFHLKSLKHFFRFPPDLAKLAFGRGHGLALTRSGHVFSWGNGTFS